MQYLSPELNGAQMYRLYKQYCQENDISNPVKEHKYRDIFLSDFRLKCFCPKKDQCTVCNAYCAAMGDGKEMLRESWEEHKAREKESMMENAVDKDRVNADDSYHYVTFDLPAVLTTQFAGDAHIYYKRKLSVYNFTIYDNSSANGHCYLWDETEGGRDANEIASILLSYLHNLPRSVRHFTSFSDTCAGQNGNQFVAAAMRHAVQHIYHLETIDLTYMESGHSYMEVDSMHATIENARKHQRIYTPREWEVVIRGARKRPHPYAVKVLKHTDFADIKELAAKKIKNKTRNTDGGIVNWLNIKWLRFEKSARTPFSTNTEFKAKDS